MDGCFADPLTFDMGYPMVTRALNESGRHIVFSCSWPAYQVWEGMKVMHSLILLKYCLHYVFQCYYELCINTIGMTTL